MDSRQHITDGLPNDIVRQRDTSDLIIETLIAMSRDDEYSATIHRILEILSCAIHADRLFVLEYQKRLDSRAFEWCAEGVAPRIQAISEISDSTLSAFVDNFRGTGIIYADTLDKLGLKDPRMRAYFERLGIRSELAVPLRKNGRFVGCLGADNYALDVNIDTERLFKGIMPFLATFISNQQLLEELEWSGSHDMLTGLLNRRGAENEINRYIAENPGAPFAIAIIDIDDFKVKNDLYGHTAGDEALTVLADAMRQTFPDDAVLARNGGDELLVMLPADFAEQADDLLERFSNLGLTFEGGGKPVELTTSIGYTVYPEPALSLADAYKQADTALYAVKLSGKSDAMRYSSGLGLQYRSQLGFTPRDIAENLPGAIMVHRIKPSGEILFANEEMIELLECDDLSDFMEFTGGTFDGLALPEDLPRVREALARQVEAGVAEAKGFADYRVRTKSGAVRAVAANSRLVDVKDIGKLFYVIIVDRT